MMKAGLCHGMGLASMHRTMTTRVRHSVLLGFMVACVGCVDRGGLGDPFGGGDGAAGKDGSPAGGSGGSTAGTGGGAGGSGGAIGGSGGGGTGGKGDAGTDAFQCGPVCKIFCEFGNVTDEHGCATCKCNPPPRDGGTDGFRCGPVCDIFCQYGNVTDDRGCPTCRCNPAPGASCDPAECHGPRPLAPNFICPDGKTVAGPACLHTAGASCEWQIVSCPAQCIQNVLCIRGDHFDPTLCRCVPNSDAGVSPACACPNGGVCVTQIGGPAIPAEPPTTCETPLPTCFGPSPCSCLPPSNGKCRPDSTVQGLCICDNGIR
jgi:hypothetical protein